MKNKHGDFIWYELITEDSHAAAKFYSKVVGWNIVASGMPGPGYDFLHTRDEVSGEENSVGGMMQLDDEMKAGGARPVWLGYIGVENIDATIQRLKAAGGSIKVPVVDIDNVGRMAMVADPQGVPFYLVTGKKMADKAALVTIEFKKPEGSDKDIVAANLLQIGIQPREGIHLKLNTKKPTVIDEMDVAEMEYCQSCQYNFNTPDSYEKLLLDVMRGDSTRFTRWDELQLSWQLTDEIAEYCRENQVLELYDDNSCGPQAAVKMLRSDGRRWWHLAVDGSEPEAYSCKTADQGSENGEHAQNSNSNEHAQTANAEGEDCACGGRCQ